MLGDEFLRQSAVDEILRTMNDELRHRVGEEKRFCAIDCQTEPVLSYERAEDAKILGEKRLSESCRPKHDTARSDEALVGRQNDVRTPYQRFDFLACHPTVFEVTRECRPCLLHVRDLVSDQFSDR